MPSTQYTQNELWKVFNKLPTELKDAVFSEETSDRIFAICERHNIEEVSQIASQVGLILMGVITPQGFERFLREEMQLPQDTAEQVFREVNRFIFYPVKPALDRLHHIGTAEGQAKTTASTAPTESSAPRTPSPFTQEKEPATGATEELEERQPSREDDPYRETPE